MKFRRKDRWSPKKIISSQVGPQKQAGKDSEKNRTNTMSPTNEEDLNSQNNQQEKKKKYVMNNNNDGNMFLNSGNNSGFGPFSFNNDLQNQKIFDFLQDFRKEQLNENRKMMNDFKEELLYELGKIVDERNEYMENNQVNIYNYYLKFNIKYKIFIL